MGNTDSAISGMQDATRVMDSIPILGGVFQMQQAATGAGVGILGGIGKTGAGLGNLLGSNPMLIIGGAVVVLILLK